MLMFLRNLSALIDFENKRVNQTQFEQAIFLSMQKDALIGLIIIMIVIYRLFTTILCFILLSLTSSIMVVQYFHDNEGKELPLIIEETFPDCLKMFLTLLFGLIIIRFVVIFIKFEIFRSVLKILDSEKILHQILNNLDEGIITLEAGQVDFKNNKA